MNSLMVTNTKVVLISTGQQYTKQYRMTECRYKYGIVHVIFSIVLR